MWERGMWTEKKDMGDNNQNAVYIYIYDGGKEETGVNKRVSECTFLGSKH